MKSTLGLIAIGLALGLTLPASAQDLPARIKSAGKVMVANTPNYPPMEYKDPANNELKGVDIELGKALAKELGVTVEWVDIGFEQMMSSVATGRVDMIQSGMTDLPKRRDALDFVDYLKTGAQFYTLFENKDAIKTPEDLCGKKVGMSRRTSFPDETAKWSKDNCEAKGKPAIEVVGTEGSADARTQLKQGRVDAAAQGSETLPYLVGQAKDSFVIIGLPFTAQYQGIGFSKSEPALRDAYVAAMTRLMASGDYKKILDSYGIAVTMLDKPMVNGEPVK